MRALSTIRVCLLSAALGISACRCYCQDAQGETLSGPDSHETGQGPHGHLFGDWGGERSRLLERGVRFDFQYVSDSLWNLESVQPERFASWNRFRWTVDVTPRLSTNSNQIPGISSRAARTEMPPDAVDEVDTLVVASKCERLRAVQSDSPAGVCRVGSTISALMSAAENGDIGAADTLFSNLYSELHRLAKRELARWGTPASLSVTTLLHEAYLDIAEREGQSFPDRARFMGYAARVMRGLIIDHARNRNAIKRGGQFEITSLKTDAGENLVDAKELSSISDALDQLAKVEPELAELVDLKFFCGLTFAEIAALRNLSERTVQRSWEKARIFLHRNIRADLEV